MQWTASKSWLWQNLSLEVIGQTYRRCISSARIGPMMGFPAHYRLQGTVAALPEYSRIEMVKRDAHPTDEHKFKAIKRLEDYNRLLMNEQEPGANMARLIN